MKVLFTGASSFTGYWFVRELAWAGHDVVATFRRQPREYESEIRKKRVALALEHCTGVFDCAFGDERFLHLVREQPWDLLCHHGAEVSSYQSPQFDVVAALAANTRNVTSVIEALKNGGERATRVVLTGSIFENDEGTGSDGLPAFSPYGLSKGFTYQTFRFHCRRLAMPLGKFVIPNPFGPYEEERFTAYLMRCWIAGKEAIVRTPDYVRDNIHVSLLARAYLQFVSWNAGKETTVFRPSGYPETQGAFALRFAKEMRLRTGMRCEVQLSKQADFSEPRVRVNPDSLDPSALGWSEAHAWDEIAQFYGFSSAAN